jgi:EAL domain-containing protein (putative c-di-GMP-specific phosphodiesterase class I)/ActR/RegA family two-component response regulator
MATLRQHAGRTILVVDDNETNVLLMTTLLRQHGLTRVHTVTDSRNAATALADVRPDLVVLDLHMPFVDGFTVLDQVRAHAAGRYLPVIVMTADTTVATRNRALEQGAQDYLVKPIDTVEAALRIANLLETVDLYEASRPAGGLPLTPDQHADVTAQVRRLLDEDAVRIVFQPVFDLTAMDVVGHEALSRFPGTAAGPDAWFATAASVGLGVDLEQHAIRHALEYLDRVPPPSFLAVNVSPAALLRRSHNDLFPTSAVDRLVAELTEHDRVEDYDAIHRAFGSLRQRGCRLAADDLGAGVANLRHLIRLQPDIVKLDISLIAGIDTSPEQRALVRALVGFAEEVGSRVIAEGIEREAELDVVRGLGVHWGQGYLLGRPAPPDAVPGLT